MKIILDSNNLGFYLGQAFEVTDEGVLIGGAINFAYNTLNTSVIDAEVPSAPLDFVWKWENNAWVCVDQEAVDAYYLNQKNTFNAEQKKKRFLAYTVESDPLFFKSQRGEATNQQWLDKIAEIDARFPYQV